MHELTVAQRKAHELALRASGYVTTALADLARGDRIDALDMLRLAQYTLAQAQRGISDSLPQVLREASVFARDTHATGV